MNPCIDTHNSNPRPAGTLTTRVPDMVSSLRATRHLLLSLVLSCVAVFNGPAFASEPVNINEASAEILAETLSGVGMTKAIRIVAYREAYGPFEHIDELAAVEGIGVATVEKNRDVILLK